MRRSHELLGQEIRYGAKGIARGVGEFEEEGSGQRYEKMSDKRERAIARRKAQKERADAAEAELSNARSTIEALELRKANLMEEMGVKAAEHKRELDRLRDSRVYEVTKERVRVETEMVAKCNKHFRNLRDWWASREPFDTMRLLQSKAFGTKKYLEALKTCGRDIPQETIDMFDAQEKQFEQEASKLNPGEIPEDDLALSPLKLDSQFVDERVFVGLNPFGTNANLIDPRTASALQSLNDRLERSVVPSRATGDGISEDDAPILDVQAADEGMVSAQDRAHTTVLEISDSSADREEEQDGKSGQDDDGEASKDQDKENPSGARGNEVTPYIGNEGMEKMVNADPPRLSADGDDTAREQVEGAEE